MSSTILNWRIKIRNNRHSERVCESKRGSRREGEEILEQRLAAFGERHDVVNMQLAGRVGGRASAAELAAKPVTLKHSET